MDTLKKNHKKWTDQLRHYVCQLNLTDPDLHLTKSSNTTNPTLHLAGSLAMTARGEKILGVSSDTMRTAPSV